MKTAELITELTEKYGVSGHESAVSDFAVEIISKYCDETNIDNMGNVIGKITGTSSENEEKQKIMIEAHMDQVGFWCLRLQKTVRLNLLRSAGY